MCRSLACPPHMEHSGGARAAGASVLIVDDFPDTADSLAALLDAYGFSAAVAYDGLQALHVAEVHRPPLILLDIDLPKLNGLEVCRHVRATEWGAEATVVAITGWIRE